MIIIGRVRVGRRWGGSGRAGKGGESDDVARGHNVSAFVETDLCRPIFIGDS